MPADGAAGMGLLGLSGSAGAGTRVMVLCSPCDEPQPGQRGREAAADRELRGQHAGAGRRTGAPGARCAKVRSHLKWVQLGVLLAHAPNRHAPDHD